MNQIHVLDKETIDKLRAKVKLYSSDNIIPFNEQKRIMEAIVRIEKQYWLALQAKSGKWWPKFIIPDALHKLFPKRKVIDILKKSAIFTNVLVLGIIP